MATIRESINAGAARLRAAGVADERLTATLLLAAVLARDRAYLLAHNRDAVAAAALNQYQEFIERRAGGEPLQYITGHQEFYGRDFLVTPAALIPRPETELIIETALSLARQCGSAPRLLDIGVGSGCIAVTLAAELPQAHITALDISLPALWLARRNAQLHQVDARIDWLAADLCSTFSPHLAARQQFDICCANPPYVAPEDEATLAREVREHEPALALYAPEQGLGLIRRLLDESAAIVHTGGYLLCEIGFGQHAAALKMIDPTRWQAQETVKDLQGILRTLVLQRC
jgi:release factor glutamine methyltransferase